MQPFLTRHANEIKCVLSGFDRVIFGGSILSISYASGVEAYLGTRGVRYADFAAHAQAGTEEIVDHAKHFAKEHERPYHYVASCHESKEALVDRFQTEAPVAEGLICILSCVESCRTFAIRKTPRGPRFISDERRCTALYYYFMDRDFGRMYVRICTWFPFPVQIYINGRSYLTRQLAREGIGFVQQDNCVTDVANVERAQQILDQLTTRKWQATLDHFSELINPLLRSTLADRRGYYWTIRQSEHATDVLFKSVEALQRVYPALVVHSMTHFGAKDVLRFLGRKLHPSLKAEVTTHRGERADAVRIKHHVGRNSIKMYDKARKVLRIETTINDPRDIRVARSQGPEADRGERRQMRKGISDTRPRVQVAHTANQRYLEALAVVGNDMPSSDILDTVTRPATRERRSHRPLHPTEPTDACLLRNLLNGVFRLRGFTNRELTARLQPRPSGTPKEARQRSARTTRLIGLLRAHALIRKSPKQRRYQLTQLGLHVATAAISARNTPVAALREAPMQA